MWLIVHAPAAWTPKLTFDGYPKTLRLPGGYRVKDTGLEFEDYEILPLFYSNYVIFCSETIKFHTSQSGCFIGDSPL